MDFRPAFFSLLPLLAGTAVTRGDVTLPSLFGSHMVLPADRPVPIWGRAEAGEAVTVQAGNERVRTTADAQGTWRLTLAPRPSTSAPITVTVSGKNTIVFTDVLAGDVWICSGQSNMVIPLQITNYVVNEAGQSEPPTVQAHDPQLRLFLVAPRTSLEPLDEVKGTWEVCSPASAAPFSGVGYYFGRELRRTHKKPIGLIGTYWGGTTAQAWTSLSGLAKEPILAHYLVDYQKIKADFPRASFDYSGRLAAYQTQLAAWRTGEGAPYFAQLRAWSAASDHALATGGTVPFRPQPAGHIPRAPLEPDGGPATPSSLFNGMIAPLIPFAIKGVIWYQGESNADSATEYRTLFRRLIIDWREKWNDGNFPFLFVQIAGYQTVPRPTWPFLREAQASALSLPNTGMATAIDLGNRIYIHPSDKRDVGLRLALITDQVAYGATKIDSGPVFQAMRVVGTTVELTFASGEAGIVIGAPPWVANDVTPLPTDRLVGFTIAGTDRQWFPAQAVIREDHLVVSNPEVPNPVAVRYAWANFPEGNLYNRVGLPAPPFRTDDWTPPSSKK